MLLPKALCCRTGSIFLSIMHRQAFDIVNKLFLEPQKN